MSGEQNGPRLPRVRGPRYGVDALPVPVVLGTAGAACGAAAAR
jgi:hypothetical protein